MLGSVTDAKFKRNENKNIDNNIIPLQNTMNDKQ